MNAPSWVPSGFDFGAPEVWARQDGAYGPPTGMGQALQLLFSPDREMHSQAERELYHHLLHQGGRFGATIYALPILLNALVHPECRARALILRFLVDAGFGVPDYHLPLGIEPDVHRRRIVHQATATSITRSEMIEPLCSAQVALEIFDEVRARRGILLPSLQAEYLDERIAACWAAAFWLSDEEDARSILAAHAMDAVGPLRWAATLALATMERAMGRDVHRDWYETALQATDERLGFVAAYAAADKTNIEGLAKPLLRGIARFEVGLEDFGGDAAAESCWRATWGDIRHKAGRLISAFAENPTDAWVDALPTADETPNVIGALDVVSELLTIVSPKRDGAFAGMQAAALTPLQRQALEAVRDHGVWGMSGDSPYLTMANQMSYAGLPTSAGALAAYLAGEET